MILAQIIIEYNERALEIIKLLPDKKLLDEAIVSEKVGIKKMRL